MRSQLFGVEERGRAAWRSLRETYGERLVGCERTPFSPPAAVARVPLGPPEVWGPPRANLPRRGARGRYILRVR